MTTYIQQQFAKARNLSAANNSNQFRLQIVGLRGHTNWLNISEEQLIQIQHILERGEKK